MPEDTAALTTTVTTKPICGVVMPISAIDGCTESHWAEVLEILSDAIEEAGFDANIVSNADDVGIIHKRIIQNLYDNPLVVCDVSGKNPNVMFELGLRLAFDKPTLIVKDDKTSYSFDTGAIEHLEYPRDLRFPKVVDFKQKLTEKLVATHSKATTDSSYTTFLKHFGEFKVATLEKKEVSAQEFLLDELRSLRMALRRIERNQGVRDRVVSRPATSSVTDWDCDICMRDRTEAALADIVKLLEASPIVASVSIDRRGHDHDHIVISLRPEGTVADIERLVGRRVHQKERGPRIVGGTG